MDILSVLKYLGYVGDVLIIAKFISAGIMCVFGYKWSKGLIATVSLYLGFSMGVLFSFWFLRLGAGLYAIIVIPIVTVLLYEAAYKNIFVNHFLAGFLAIVKIWNLIMVLLMQIGNVKISMATMIIIPSILGIIGGIVGLVSFNNNNFLLCIAYIGATEFVSGIANLASKTMFSVTGDFGYLWGSDLEDIVLSILGYRSSFSWGDNRDSNCMCREFSILEEYSRKISYRFDAYWFRRQGGQNLNI